MLVTFADFTTIAFVVGSSWARRTRAPTATKKSILRRLSQARGRRRCDSCDSTIFAGCSRHVLVTIACLGWRFYYRPANQPLQACPLFRSSASASQLTCLNATHTVDRVGELARHGALSRGVESSHHHLMSGQLSYRIARPTEHSRQILTFGLGEET